MNVCSFVCFSVLNAFKNHTSNHREILGNHQVYLCKIFVNYHNPRCTIRVATMQTIICVCNFSMLPYKKLIVDAFSHDRIKCCHDFYTMLLLSASHQGGWHTKKFVNAFPHQPIILAISWQYNVCGVSQFIIKYIFGLCFFI